MNWKMWKRGLLVSCLTGLATAGCGLAVGITFKQAGLLTLATVAKDALLFMQGHPVDQIQDTTFITKPK